MIFGEQECDNAKWNISNYLSDISKKILYHGNMGINSGI